MTQHDQRPPYFAQKFIRTIVKTCVAQELGLDVFALLVVIVTTEDCRRYRGPVTFYNAQILGVLGFGKWERLAKARAAAVKAGWLEYEAPPGGSRRPGKYRVAIPTWAEGLPDNPLDDTPERIPERDMVNRLSPANGDGQGDAQGYGQGYGQGDAQGEPPILSPVPVPTPVPKRERARFVPPTVEQVSEYAGEIGFATLDAAYFVDYHVGNGWVQGKNCKPIRDWKAVVRTWKRNEGSFGNGKHKHNGRGPGQKHDAARPARW